MEHVVGAAASAHITASELLQRHLPDVGLQLVLLIEEQYCRRLLPALQEGVGRPCCQLLSKLQCCRLAQPELHARQTGMAGAGRVVG